MKLIWILIRRNIEIIVHLQNPFKFPAKLKLKWRYHMTSLFGWCVLIGWGYAIPLSLLIYLYQHKPISVLVWARAGLLSLVLLYPRFLDFGKEPIPALQCLHRMDITHDRRCNSNALGVSWLFYLMFVWNALRSIPLCMPCALFDHVELLPVWNNDG